MSFYFYFFFCLLAYRTHQAVQPLGSTSILPHVSRLVEPNWHVERRSRLMRSPTSHRRCRRGFSKLTSFATTSRRIPNCGFLSAFGTTRKEGGIPNKEA